MEGGKKPESSSAPGSPSTTISIPSLLSPFSKVRLNEGIINRPRSSIHSKLSIKNDIFENKNELGPKYIIFMVGLPARGKSYICKKMSRYLSWCGYKTRVFNVGNRRRLIQSFSPASDSLDIQSGSEVKTEGWFLEPSATESSDAECMHHHAAAFFDPGNMDASALRDQAAMSTLEEVFAWLDRGGKVAIHDATNSTVQRRKVLLETVAAHHTNIQAFFVESICTDQQVLQQNMQMKLQGPDYAHMDPEKALQDFKERIANYEKSYATISEEEEEHGLSYIKIINVGKKVIANGIHGYLPSQCVLYLMQIHIKPRTIWLTRHGESEYNVLNRIGGDPSLTLNGRVYAKALTRFFSSRFGGRNSVVSSTSGSTDFMDGSEASTAGLEILTSTLRRTIETVEGLNRQGYSVQHMRVLNELYSGYCEDMTFEEAQKAYPMEFSARFKNKLVARYPGPGGESYADVIERVQPLIVELERMESDVLVVTHQAVSRTLLAYFLGIPLEEMTNTPIPLHTLFCIQPKPYGADLTKFVMDPKTGKLVEEPKDL